MLVEAGVNLTLEHMWKLIINMKKEYIASQMSVKEQNGIAKQKVMVIAKTRCTRHGQGFNW